MARPLHIAFVSLSDADNVRHWSGTTYNMALALARQPGIRVTRIDNLAHQGRGLTGRLLWLRKAVHRLQGKRFDIQREPAWLRGVAAEVQTRLPADVDIVFSDSSLPLAWLETRAPMAFYTDACFAGMLGFYLQPEQLAAATLRHGRESEARALARCARVFYASDWAARTAAAAYGVPGDKLRIVPMGANLETAPTREAVAAQVAARRRDGVDLLFCGVEWERKGGDTAVEIVGRLQGRGIDARLHIAGIRQLPPGLPDFVVDHGFLSKAVPEQAAKLWALFGRSHLLLLPTRAEAFGLVFCEASAFGLPSVASDVGGVPTIVQEGHNGKTFALSTPPDEQAAWIAALMADRAGYEALALRAHDHFAQRLNWEVAARTVVDELRTLAA